MPQQRTVIVPRASGPGTGTDGEPGQPSRGDEARYRLEARQVAQVQTHFAKCSQYIDVMNSLELEGKNYKENVTICTVTGNSGEFRGRIPRTAYLFSLPFGGIPVVIVWGRR